MSLDLANVFDVVERVVKSGASVRDGMEELLSYYQANLPSSVWGRIRLLDFDQDVQALKEWLEEVLSNDPPDDDIEAFWFGLYNTEYGFNEVSCGMYIMGSDHFDPEDASADWARDCIYNPKGQAASSVILHQIFRMVQGVDKEVASLGEYGLCLGYAGLTLNELCRTIDRRLLLGNRDSRGVAVGWDSGDFLLLPSVVREH